jgi:hypothetical protein
VREQGIHSKPPDIAVRSSQRAAEMGKVGPVFVKFPAIRRYQGIADGEGMPFDASRGLIEGGFIEGGLKPSLTNPGCVRAALIHVYEA